tara:strand:+ start:223 stop:1041 length:819 start_codon:yes stop_codon:yes gene_type:complete
MYINYYSVLKIKMGKYNIYVTEISGLIGRNKYQSCEDIWLRLWKRHHRRDYQETLKKFRQNRDKSDKIKKDIESNRTVMRFIQTAVRKADSESTEKTLNLVDKILQPKGTLTRQRIKYHNEVMNEVRSKIYRQIGTSKEDAGLKLFAKRKYHTIEKGNTETFTASYDDFTIRGKIDGFDRVNNRVIEHKQRQKRLFNGIPDYEKVQLMAYMFMTGATSSTLVQTHKSYQREQDFEWDEEEWNNIENNLKESIFNFKKAITGANKLRLIKSAI